MTSTRSNTPARDYADRSIGSLTAVLQALGANVTPACIEQVHHALAIAYCQGVIEAMGNLSRVEREVRTLSRPGSALRPPESDESYYGCERRVGRGGQL